MQRLFVLLLFLYFSLGTLLLPQGDFSTLPDIPKMYAHCKATEDYDMDIPDFIAEHLFQINDLMGEVPDPNDKPHQPVQFHHLFSPITVAVRGFVVVARQDFALEKNDRIVIDEKYLSDFPASVFRPPIA